MWCLREQETFRAWEILPRQLYVACFADPNSVLVLDHVESVVAGCAILDGWLKSTMHQGGGRSYHRKLFGLPDRMLWVTGLIHYERARELEDWAMEAISEIFPKFRVNKNASCLVAKNFSSDRPTGSYLQPVRPYSGDLKQFDRERIVLNKNKNDGRRYADLKLAKRFAHPSWSKGFFIECICASSLIKAIKVSGHQYKVLVLARGNRLWRI